MAWVNLNEVVTTWPPTGGITAAVGDHVWTVDTYTELRAISTNDVDDISAIVRVGGHTTVGDGGQGYFYFDEASSDADDNGITILPTGYAGVGRWKRSYSGAVNVKWFGATGDGTTDDTTAVQAAINFANAQGGGVVFFPEGTYVVDNVRAKDKVRLLGEGYRASFLKQGSDGNPAYYVLSDVTTGQLLNCGIEHIGVQGSAAPTVAAVIVRATSPYVVHDSTFAYKATNTYAALLADCPNAEIYENRFDVYSVASSSCAVTATGGGYNQWDLFLVECGNGLALDTLDGGSLYRVISDGSQVYRGQNNVILNPTIEGIYPAAASSSAESALEFRGTSNTVIRPTVTEVDGAKLSTNTAIQVYGYNSIIEPRVWGTTYPSYPITLGVGCKSTFIGGDTNCTFTIRQYESETALNAQTFIGDCSSYLGGTSTNLSRLRYPTIPIGGVAYGSLGTNTTPVAGTVYLAELWIDRPKSLTGIGVLNGTAVGTDKHIVALFDGDGALVANSDLAGTTTAGADSFQEIAFTSAYVAPAGRYFIGLQMNGTTDRFRSIAASTFVDVRTKSSVGAFGTLPTQTAPTTFTANVGPIAYAY